MSSVQQGKGSEDMPKSSKPRCSVIGTGDAGSAMIRQLTAHGYEVRMTHEGSPEELEDLAKETGAKPVSLDEVAKDTDVVFLCVPLKSVQELPKQLFSGESLIVVDCCNYYPSRDGHISEIDEGMPQSIWVKNQIGKDVVKAFNSILADALVEAGCPKNTQERISLPFCGDDPKAKETIATIIDELGFDPYDAGDLKMSWRQEPGSPAYCTNLTSKHMEKAISSAKHEDMPKFRDEAYHKMKSSGDKPLDWNSLVKLLRETYVSEHSDLKEVLGMGTGPSEVKTS